MIRFYESGEQFLAENRAFLESDPAKAAFIVLDAPLLKQPDRDNYAIAVLDNSRKLVALKVVPYSFMLFGDAALLGELYEELRRRDLAFDAVLAETSLGAAFTAICERDGGISYRERHAMDFMQATEITEPSSPLVESPRDADVPELTEGLTRFFAECDLSDTTSETEVARFLPSFRVLRADGKIASFARRYDTVGNAGRISHVYTRPEYRGRGLARQVVNTVKNDVLASGRIATLNVDQKNPISNHLYESLGFRRVFSMSLFERKK